MGVLNVTPDSFSDGGEFLDPEAAATHGERLAAEGADLVDVGGESTRPGAEPVTAQVELERVMPPIEALARHGIALSIDTSKAAVARSALAAGASFVNDVTALRGDPELGAAVAEAGGGGFLVHKRGGPRPDEDRPPDENGGSGGKAV